MGLMLATRHQKGGGVSTRWVSMFCISSFCLGVFVVNRLWSVPDPVNVNDKASVDQYQDIDIEEIIDCNKKEASIRNGDILMQVSQTHEVIMTLDKTISTLEMQLAATRAAQIGNLDGSPMATKPGTEQTERQKVFFVMGIITAFSNKKRRNSIRATWMPQGENLRKLEKDKGIVIRFVIGHSASPGGVLDHAIDEEEEEHRDFLRLNHIEGYDKLSFKTQVYLSTAVAKWDADFYIKVDDDVHVNPEGSSTMSLNTGNLVRREASILDMQQDSCMQSPKIWQHTYQPTSTYYIDMQMKMSLWALGSLV